MSAVRLPGLLRLPPSSRSLALALAGACRADFSLTSGTLFAFHKLPIRTYLAAIVIFVNEVKGKSALALSRDLDVQYKTAFVLAHKLREAMAWDMNLNPAVGRTEHLSFAIVQPPGASRWRHEARR